MDNEYQWDGSRFHIVGHKLCPYVQRVVILALEKEIYFERTDIELHNKPEWLKRLSPTGKVPVLIIDNNKALFESAVICEYLDEVTAGSIHPENALEKALHRSWIEFGSGILDCIAQIIYQDMTCDSFELTVSKIVDRLHIVEQELSDETYFASSKFHLVDAVYATIFRYFDVLNMVTNKNILCDFSKLKVWSNALSQRKSIKNAVSNDYTALLIQFVKTRDTYLSTQLQGHSDCLH